MFHVKKIFIIRHGETEFNRLGIVQGSGIDSDLNETGQKQADAFYEYYKNEPFQKIYTSSLKRTHQSVQKFIENNFPISHHEALNEINWGGREGKLPNNADNLYFYEITSNWQKGNTHLKFENGESPEEVALRQASFIQLIIKNKEESTILIATHGRALKILLAQVLHQDLSKMDDFEHTNLCLYILEYDYEKNCFQLVLANDTSHLHSLKSPSNQ